MSEAFVDFGKAANDYARYRQGFPPDFMPRLKAHGVGLEGQRVLDVGTRTGLLAFAFLREGCEVVGLDRSADLLARAREIALRERLNVEFVEGRAESTGFPESSFDVVSAATCWHWFDKEAAAREAARILKPGGSLVIAALDWQTFPGNVPEKTIEVIRRFAQPETGPSIYTFHYPDWTGDLVAAGFRSWELFGYPASLAYTHEAWRGRVRASRGIGPALDKHTLERFDTALGDMLAASFPSEPMAVDHRVSALVARKQGL